MKVYLFIPTFLLIIGTVFSQGKKETQKNDSNLLTTRSFFVKLKPQYVGFQDTKQNDLQYYGINYAVGFGYQLFTKSGNIFHVEPSIGLSGSLTNAYQSTESTYSAFGGRLSYLFNVKKYKGWSLYVGPEFMPNAVTKTNTTIGNNTEYVSLEVPLLVKITGVKEIRNQTFRFDVGLALFGFVAENNGFAGSDYSQLKVEEKKVDYREFEPSTLDNYIEQLRFFTVNQFFEMYINTTYQFNSRFQFNYQWGYSAFSSVSGYPRNIGTHTIGVAFYFGKLK